MSLGPAATGIDRLPWLADEPIPSDRRRTNRELACLTLAAMLLVAIGSYWIGEHNRREAAPPKADQYGATTVALPQAAKPRTAEPPQPQVLFEPPPQVSPVPEREVPMARPMLVKSPTRFHRPTAATPRPSPPAAAGTPSLAPASEQVAPKGKENHAAGAAENPLALWPAWQSHGAAGRIVRIGAFGSRFQAKLGWRFMVRAYPAVAHLPATVVETRNSRDRYFYRFQIGTTSQAHSEVLCQRMEKIHLSCAVIGLAWNPKGVER